MSYNKIFVSYRRQDASGEAGRLVDNLEEVFGSEAVFLDVETLEAGLDFVQAIDQALNNCKVLIAIIGPHWANIKDADGNLRLFNEGDFIRIEISAALERDIRVIPVLVNGARMPSDSELPEELKALNRRHAHELSSSRWKYDTDQLIAVLSKIIEPQKKPVNPEPIRPRPIPQPKQKGWFAKNYLWVLGIFVVLIVLFALGSEDFQEGYEDGLAASSTEYAVIPPPVSNDQESRESATMTGNWSVYLNGEKVSTFVMTTLEDGVEFTEYDLINNNVGNGMGYREGNQLFLDYYNTTEDVVGEFYLTTGNQGVTWEGLASFPSIQVETNITLRKD
ncbi:toll/interleukin-1 receptor domain-containing protein [Algoriphagus namhaensis]|uniref:Toll/interleukin-1 receptor domain-containing protein n=1 Tax=Algoriphagus namhaensis TaxID=915353 RepID=A0ABV8AY63_9BACT